MALDGSISATYGTVAGPTLTPIEGHPPWRTLSSREREVLHWLSLGKSAEDVATILDLSISTIMFHCRTAAQKYGTVNRTHTVAEAFRRGDLPIDEEFRITGGGCEMYEI
jgi:DNA-binding CsgD family transcriptional regulator